MPLQLGRDPPSSRYLASLSPRGVLGAMQPRYHAIAVALR